MVVTRFLIVLFPRLNSAPANSAVAGAVMEVVPANKTASAVVMNRYFLP